MFDIGFLELLIIAVISLIIVGPERLPSAIRSVLRVTRRLKTMASQARAEIENQIGVDEIKQDISNEELIKSLQKLKNLEAKANDVINDDEDEDNTCASKAHKTPPADH